MGFGINGNPLGLPRELVRMSHDVDFKDGEATDLVLVYRNGEADTRLLTLRVEDTARLLPLLAPSALQHLQGREVRGRSLHG